MWNTGRRAPERVSSGTRRIAAACEIAQPPVNARVPNEYGKLPTDSSVRCAPHPAHLLAPISGALAHRPAPLPPPAPQPLLKPRRSSPSPLSTLLTSLHIRPPL